MNISQILVTMGGLIVIGWIAWYFWFAEKKAIVLGATPSGIQEAYITVKGGYSPDVIVVEAGKPVRLNFRREETALCSEQVLIPDFGKQATLTPFKTIPVEFIPDKKGEFGFQCGMGMLHGKIIVE